MKKDLGVKPLLFPMPVAMIATYCEDGRVDVMNMAWGGICAPNMIELNLTGSHKTTKNIEARRAFTLSIADVKHVVEADYFGLASGNSKADKFEHSGMHAVKSTRVDAPIVEEFPITLECKVASIDDVGGDKRIVGEIVNVLADESVMSGDSVDIKKADPLIFNTFGPNYFSIGSEVAPAYEIGKKML